MYVVVKYSIRQFDKGCFIEGYSNKIIYGKVSGISNKTLHVLNKLLSRGHAGVHIAASWVNVKTNTTQGVTTPAKAGKALAGFKPVTCGFN